ncbi:pentatricopeptide repeat-containing protein At4g21190-like [Papaver somniferum]|uniref:pentatricopeptide repeat-containing protein At4g21190-like n=1 Tax=Papaver somniferum TaxID=3469 RepID=UPI000E6F5CA9|nr:pentatricopeptide repeat-containing protein At4g21190-like [Papaver somniferum]
MLSLRYSPAILLTKRLETIKTSRTPKSVIVCAAKGPRPRYPRVWKANKKIGTISKSKKFVDCIKELSNVKEEVYGALDSFIAWELEFPLITVKKALKTLEEEREWKRIIQVTKWMLSKGQGRTMGSYFTLLNALAHDDRIEEAEELWAKVFSENLEALPRIFFNKMISIYYSRDMHDKMFEIFADMEELGVKPNVAIVSMVGDVFQKLGMLDKYEKLSKKYPPPTWEYRYFKGKRVKIRAKNLKQFDEDQRRSREPHVRGNKLLGEGSVVEATELLSEESSAKNDGQLDEADEEPNEILNKSDEADQYLDEIDSDSGNIDNGRGISPS